MVYVFKVVDEEDEYVVAMGNKFLKGSRTYNKRAQYLEKILASLFSDSLCIVLIVTVSRVFT
jgi:hypothetical protein